MDNQGPRASQGQIWKSFFAMLKGVSPFFQQVESEPHRVLSRGGVEGYVLCLAEGSRTVKRERQGLL